MVVMMIIMRIIIIMKETNKKLLVLFIFCTPGIVSVTTWIKTNSNCKTVKF